jgi:hypothetical protein
MPTGISGCVLVAIVDPPPLKGLDRRYQLHLGSVMQAFRKLTKRPRDATIRVFIVRSAHFQVRHRKRRPGARIVGVDLDRAVEGSQRFLRHLGRLLHEVEAAKVTGQFSIGEPQIDENAIDLDVDFRSDFELRERVLDVAAHGVDLTLSEVVEDA